MKYSCFCPVKAVTLLKGIIRNEYLKTNKCQLSIVGGGAGFLGSRPLGWLLAKNNPYLKEFDLGYFIISILQSIYFFQTYTCLNKVFLLHDTGLIQFWGKQMENPRPCYNYKKINSQITKQLVRLSLANLAG